MLNSKFKAIKLFWNNDVCTYQGKISFYDKDKYIYSINSNIERLTEEEALEDCKILLNSKI